jgi:RNA polymerase sigma factor (sigma-70 family)
MNSLKLNNLSDEQLIEKIRAEGKKELYGVLYARYFPKVKDKCYSFLKNNARAEEFANDIFSKVFEKLDSYQGKSLFSSWLYSVSYNMIIDYLRKKKQLHYPNWNQDNELPEIIDESVAEIEELSYDNLMEVLEKCIPKKKPSCL